MIDFIRNFVILPILALLLSMAIYLCSVELIYALLTNSPYVEDLLWKFSVNKEIIGIYGDNRGNKLHNILNKLPTTLLPKQYSEIQLVITKDDEINAFAAPAGKIILTTGLLNKIESEPALLFIISHEVAHLIKKDHLREVSRNIVANFYKIITWSDLFAEMLLLIDNNKIKNNEFIADNFAAKLLYYQYGDINGAYHLLNTLSSYTPNNSSIFHSHPSPQERIEKLKTLSLQR